MQYDTFSDEELIEKLRQGEDDITDYILEKYKPLVSRCAKAMYLIGGENEDLIQEGMIGLFKAVRDYRSDKNSGFYHFAEMCINRQLYSAVKASNRKKHMPLNSYVSLSAKETETGASVSDGLLGETRSPEQMVIEGELWKEFRQRLVGKLSKMEKQVLQLYLDGNNYIQIAGLMEKSAKAIDNALQRIRQKIRQMKIERG